MLDERLIKQVIAVLMPYHPSRIGVFGSFARGEQKKGSDLDILISFKKKTSLLKLVQIQQELSDELGMQVDLVTENSLKNPRLKNTIHQELITIFQDEKRPILS